MDAKAIKALTPGTIVMYSHRPGRYANTWAHMAVYLGPCKVTKRTRTWNETKVVGGVNLTLIVGNGTPDNPYTLRDGTEVLQAENRCVISEVGHPGTLSAVEYVTAMREYRDAVNAEQRKAGDDERKAMLALCEERMSWFRDLGLAVGFDGHLGWSGGQHVRPDCDPHPWDVTLSPNGKVTLEFGLLTDMVDGPTE